MRSTAARAALAVVVLVAVAASIPGAIAPASATATQAGVTTTPAGATETGTTMRIVLAPDGDARWTITIGFSLKSQNETRAFERLAAEYTSGETEVLSPKPFRKAATLASDATGRPMAIRNVSQEARREADRGELTLSFTWTNFTRIENGRMELGDVFVTESGTWLPGIAADQELVIDFPDGYAVQNSSRPLEDGAFHVEGPATFAPGQPSATLLRTDPTPSQNGTGGEHTETPPGTALSTLVGVSVAVALLGAVGYLVVRRGRETRDSPDDGEMPIGTVPGDDEEPAVELLSDEERVLRLLGRNGGRMKQVDIVEATDWSNAKVSQLLSSMDETDKIEKLRIGRENLISLPDERVGESE